MSDGKSPGADLPSLQDVYDAEHAGEADPPVWGEGCKSFAELELKTWCPETCGRC